MEIIGFMILSLIAFILDVSTNKCTKILQPSMYYLLFLHHLLTIIICYGWFSNNKTFLWIYLFVPIAFMVYWELNNNKCDITMKFNDSCGNNKDEFFHDFLYFLGLKHNSKSKTLRSIYVLICMIITLWKLSKH